MIVSNKLNAVDGVRHGFLDTHEALPVGTYHLHQVHSNRVIVLEGADSPTQAELAQVDADALIARSRTIAVRTADCIPVLMADRRGGAVAAVHAGWRGLESGILPAAVDALTRLGVRPMDLEVALGPSIAACCYEVSRSISDAFEKKWSHLWKGKAPLPWSDRPRPSKRPVRSTASKREEGIFIDLQSIARLQLRASGIDEAQIDEPGHCTYCGPPEFASYRRATHESAPRSYQWSFVGVDSRRLSIAD